MKIFFIEGNRVNATDEERMLNYQLFRIAKGLDSGKLLIMRAAYAIRDEIGNGERPIQSWAEAVATKLGHGLSALVLEDESPLMELGLILTSQRWNSRAIKAKSECEQWTANRPWHQTV